ncbi:hypothetical protein Zm00014a_021201 [Zea mays]|uniref:Uncharacterized protein n=1 Tax=Zea mays TaxID=4577 RepID=A0A3L6G5S4_MAIZE|nr:hypothetical protein Zm00014a_021201 [Zea mays]
MLQLMLEAVWIQVPINDVHHRTAFESKMKEKGCYLNCRCSMLVESSIT